MRDRRDWPASWAARHTRSPTLRRFSIWWRAARESPARSLFPSRSLLVPAGRTLVPIRGLLKAVRRVQELAFRKMRPDELQAHGQPLDEPAGQRQSGQSRQIGADGVD